MKIEVITLFPSMFAGPFAESIIKRAKDQGLVEIAIHNLRDWAIDKHGTVDDKPYGGGVGMVLRPEPIVAALRYLGGGRRKGSSDGDRPKRSAGHGSSEVSGMRKTILLSASGKLYNQQKALHLSRLSHLTLICGHYEGVDQRIADYYCDEELSIGDYILTGGEIPAMVIVDSVVRLIPGVLIKKDATKNESFSSFPSYPASSPLLALSEVEGSEVEGSLLESPHYTRPEVFNGHQVPEVLRSGNHKEIEKWKKEESLKRTQKNRPDLLRK